MVLVVGVMAGVLCRDIGGVKPSVSGAPDISFNSAASSSNWRQVGVDARKMAATLLTP